MNTNPSQSNIILSTLKKWSAAHKEGGWVPGWYLYRVSGAMAVHSRIAELRKRGHKIPNRQETSGRARRSYYRLEAQS